MNRSAPSAWSWPRCLPRPLPIGAALAQSPAPAASPTAHAVRLAGPGRLAASPSPRRPRKPHPAPAALGKPHPTASPCRPGGAAGCRADAGHAAARRADRRSLRRGVTLAAKKVVIAQGQRQLGFGLRHPDRFVQGADRAARQAGHQAAGNPMIVYTSTDDTGFTFMAEIPVDQDAEEPRQEHEHGQIAGRQGAEIRPSRLLRQHGQHL